MIFDFDFDAVEESKEFKGIPAGGYVARVLDVIVNLEKKHLKLVMDYAEGEYAGHGESVEEKTGKTYGYITGYISWRTPGAQSMLKRTVRLLDESNPSKNIMEQFKHENFDVLKGSKIGVVMGEEEYLNKNNEIKTKLTLPNFTLVEDIHNGNFRVPAKKLYVPKDDMGAPVTDNEKIPF